MNALLLVPELTALSDADGTVRGLGAGRLPEHFAASRQAAAGLGQRAQTRCALRLLVRVVLVVVRVRVLGVRQGVRRVRVLLQRLVRADRQTDSEVQERGGETITCKAFGW
jgi:hypothetical protein